MLGGHRCLLADYHGQSLLKLIQSAPPLAVRQIQSIARQLFDIVARESIVFLPLSPNSNTSMHSRKRFGCRNRTMEPQR